MQLACLQLLIVTTGLYVWSKHVVGYQAYCFTNSFSHAPIKNSAMSSVCCSLANEVAPCHKDVNLSDWLVQIGHC